MNNSLLCTFYINSIDVFIKDSGDGQKFNNLCTAPIISAISISWLITCRSFQHFVFKLISLFAFIVLLPGSLYSQSCDTSRFQLINGGFEQPIVSGFAFVPNDKVPGWDNESEDVIEVWEDGLNDVPAFEGRQFVELNANVYGILFQDVNTCPGQVFNWSIAHRGRFGVDKAVVEVGAPNGPYKLLQTMIDDQNKWGTYQGSYAIPAGQTVTRIRLRSVAAATNSPGEGNFVDAFQFIPVTVGRCCIYRTGQPTYCASGLDINECIKRFGLSGSGATDVLWSRGKTCMDSCSSLSSSISGLPLQAFNANYLNETQSVLLSWQMTGDQNTAGFFVERSRDGQKFKKIAFLKGPFNAPDKTYQFTDIAPFVVGYYRLVQLTDSGTLGFSKTLSVFGGASGKLFLFPNPATDKIHIRLNNMQSFMVDVKVYDHLGQLLIKQTIDHGEQPEVNISNLPNGIYTIRVGLNGKVYNEKLIKE